MCPGRQKELCSPVPSGSLKLFKSLSIFESVPCFYPLRRCHYSGFFSVLSFRAVKSLGLICFGYLLCFLALLHTCILKIISVRNCQQPLSLSPITPWELTSWLSEAVADISQAHCISLATLLSLSCHFRIVNSHSCSHPRCLPLSVCKDPTSNTCSLKRADVFPAHQLSRKLRFRFFSHHLCHRREEFSGIKAGFTEHLLSPLPYSPSVKV